MNSEPKSYVDVFYEILMGLAFFLLFSGAMIWVFALVQLLFF